MRAPCKCGMALRNELDEVIPAVHSRSANPATLQRGRPMHDTMTLETAYAHVGFVWAWRFDEEGKGDLVMPEELPVALSERQPDGEPGMAHGWIHLNLTDRRAIDWISNEDWFDDQVKELLTGTEPRQSLDFTEDGTVFGVLGDFQRQFERETDELGYIRFVMGRTILVTARRHPLRAAHELQHQLMRGRTVDSSVDALALIVERILDDVGGQVRDMSREIDEIEDFVLDDKVRDQRRRLGPARRRAVRLHRLLAGVHTSFKRLSSPDISETVSDYVRDRADGLLQRADSLHQDVYALQERARLLQEEINSKIQDTTNRHLFVLSILTILFMPPTLISGLFGMNVHGLPFAEWEESFWLVLGVAGLSALAVYFLIRRRGMLD